ncbi:hypothetical protein HAX54_013139 [Datura stramonium]|uniref:Uncharacterized protein n=1 Tax=Datura stramonium TaxID=4076 RepID=A0ABS8TMS8_DATST|nr:hypothetical protein [Datura stramonium]
MRVRVNEGWPMKFAVLRRAIAARGVEAGHDECSDAKGKASGGMTRLGNGMVKGRHSVGWLRLGEMLGEGKASGGMTWLCDSMIKHDQMQGTMICGMTRRRCLIKCRTRSKSEAWDDLPYVRPKGKASGGMTRPRARGKAEACE